MPRSFRDVEKSLALTLRGLAIGELDWPLYLHGPVGTGKTLAALCLCDIVPGSLYYTLDGLADVIVAGEGNFYFGEIAKAPLAVLDEIGTRAKDQDLHYQAAKRFCDAREGVFSAAIYISNLPPSELADHYDDRIADRMTRGKVCLLRGESRRRRAG